MESRDPAEVLEELRGKTDEEGQLWCGCGRPFVPIFDKNGKRTGVTHTIEDDAWHMYAFSGSKYDPIEGEAPLVVYGWYDEEKQTLEVEYIGALSREFVGVSPETNEAFRTAPSLSAYVNEVLIPNYESRDLLEEESEEGGPLVIELADDHTGEPK